MPLNKTTTLQDICTSLETSRKLAEAGFPQEGGIAYWVSCYKEGIFIADEEYDKVYNSESYRKLKNKRPTVFIFMPAEEVNFEWNIYIRAWSFSELWEILPKIITIGNEIYYRRLLVPAMIGYLRTTQSKRYKLIQGENIQEAAAELALWCVKEGYL
jgi:hypothetical protein